MKLAKVLVALYKHLSSLTKGGDLRKENPKKAYCSFSSLTTSHSLKNSSKPKRNPKAIAFGLLLPPRLAIVS